MTEDTFNNKVVVITGASQGIGKALAYELANQGALLTLASRNTELLESVASECRGRGTRAIVVSTNVGDELQCKNLINRTIDEYGRLDALVNNAGFGQAGKVEALSNLNLFDQVMQVNFMGCAYCTYYALPHIIKTQGRIIGVSSVGGIKPHGGFASYCASKYAMVGFLQSLALEMADQGVSITLIYPDIVLTEFRHNIFNEKGNPVVRTYTADEQAGMMSAETCAQLIIEASLAREPEVLMALGSDVPVSRDTK